MAQYFFNHCFMSRLWYCRCVSLIICVSPLSRAFQHSQGPPSCPSQISLGQHMRLALEFEDCSLCLLYNALFHLSFTTKAGDNNGPARCIPEGLGCHFLKHQLAPGHCASLNWDSVVGSGQNGSRLGKWSRKDSLKEMAVIWP